MTTLCCLGNSSTRRWPKQESGGGSEPIVEFMKPPRGLMRKKKRQHSMNKEEVKQDLVLKNTSNLLTLEEWILASPNRNSCKSSRVYPTFEKRDEGLYKKTGDSFSMLIMEVDEGDREMEDSSSRLRLNGKTKKKVTFKIPEVADIFILDSPGGYHSM